MARAVPYIILVVAIGLMAWHSISIRFVQDDSFITYRYANNMVRGYGPVFNKGERVEGFTNFLWLMLISLMALTGLDWNSIIPLTQYLGLLCGAGALIFMFLLIRRFSREHTYLSPLPLLLIAANGAYAYWCVSGMETGLFTLLVTAGLYFYAADSSRRGHSLSSALLGLSAVTRPEGALFLAIVLVHFLLTRLRRTRQVSAEQNLLRDLGNLLLPFLLLVIPLYVWRLTYYKRLFPNTFYAKTGLSVSYIKSGLDYLWDFLRAYGLWGLLPAGAATVLLRHPRRRSLPFTFFILLLLVYSAYVVAVGGDVLRIFRFFVLGEAIWALPRALPRAVPSVALLLLLPYTFIGPFARERSMRSEILRNQLLENGLVAKMSATGRWLSRHLSEKEWFACTTIGAISFYSDRKLVDMLGLTDSTIALHPENIMGPRVYWKERNYNTRHVLSLNPRYIYFSTGAKPSAAAERALFLRRRFRLGYYPCLFTSSDGSGFLADYIYARRPQAETISVETIDGKPEFVDLYNLGINLTRSRRTLDSAIQVFHRCIEIAPADFAYPWEWIGTTLLQLGRTDEAINAFQRALAIDSWCITSHEYLGVILHERGLSNAAAHHFARLVEYAPDYAQGYLNYANSLATLGDLAVAESVLEQAALRFPNYPKVSEYLNRLKQISASTGRPIRQSASATGPDSYRR